MSIKIDLTYLDEVAGDDLEFKSEMIKRFSDQTPEYISMINNAIKEENISDVKRIAHKMKPTFLYVGLKEIQEKVEILEQKAERKDDFNSIKRLWEEILINFDEAEILLRQKLKEWQLIN